jgi:hypothetical protein
MDRFFNQENIKRYRKLHEVGTTENQRAVILKQLAEEEMKFRDMQRLVICDSKTAFKCEKEGGPKPALCDIPRGCLTPGSRRRFSCCPAQQ